RPCAFLTRLAAHAADAQQLAPRNKEPRTIILVNTTFDDAIGFVGRQGGIDVQFDESATPERRGTKLTLRMKDVTLEEALAALPRMPGLPYKVVDTQPILIHRLP